MLGGCLSILVRHVSGHIGGIEMDEEEKTRKRSGGAPQGMIGRKGGGQEEGVNE